MERNKLIVTIATYRFIKGFTFDSDSNIPNEKQYDMMIRYANELKRNTELGNLDTREEYETIIEELQLLKDKNAIAAIC